MSTENQKFEIISKYNNGWCINKIAESMNINRHTASIWINRYKINGNIYRKSGTSLNSKKRYI